MEHSNTVATLLALFLILWTIISMRARDTDTSPAILHNAVWAGALLIVGSGLMRYTPMSGYAWLLIASAILAFNIGVAIAGARSKYRSGNPVPIVTAKPLLTRRMYRTLILGFSVGFTVYLVTIGNNYGLATLIRNPASIRGYTDVTYLEAFPLYGKLLFYLGPLCLILTIFPEFVQGLRKSPLVWRLAIMVYLAAAQVAALQRTNIFIAIVWTVGLLILRLRNQDADGQPRRVTPKRVVSLTVAAIFGFIVFQSLALALGKEGTNNTAITSVVDPRLRNSPALSVMGYASSGVVAFGKLTDSQNTEWPPALSRGPVYGDYNPQTWGAATLAGPLKLIPGIRHWNEIGPFVFLPMPTNVYTWLDPWYRDFRWLGVLCGPFIAGAIIGSFAKRRHHSPEAMLAAGLLIGFSILTTFANKYMSVMTIVIYFALWFLGTLRRSRETAEQRRGVEPRRPVLS